MSEIELNGRRALLVIAHPGHELRLYEWLRRTRPLVLVLTDGSGRGAISRIDKTTAILAATGASAGAYYGRLSDRELYHRIIESDVAMLRDFVDAIVDAACTENVACIAGDALEGFNPGHDLCRYAINAAVAVLAGRHRRQVANYAFALDGPPATAARAGDGVIRLEVDGEALAAKVEAVRGYQELADNVDDLLHRHGRALFAHEELVPASIDEGRSGLTEEPPHYELVGQQRIESGEYEQVIRYRQHVLPLVDELWQELEFDAG